MSKIVDASGLPCPLPLVKLKKALAEGDGDIELLTTDRGALADIPAFCQQKKLSCQLVDTGSVLTFLIQKEFKFGG